MRTPVFAVVSSACATSGLVESWRLDEVAVETGLDFDALLGVVPPASRPWLQRTVRAAAASMVVRLRRLPARAAGWGAGPDRAWCAW